MKYLSITRRAVIILAFTGASAVSIYADPMLDKLIAEGKYKEAIDYADDKLPSAQRDATVWVKIAKANEALGMPEKSLACFMVAWRMNPDNYQALLGAAKVYNKMGQPDNALTMAKKALEKNFTAEASWEYARACIALKRPAEAKTALEKVIESDSSNQIANKELGTIYFSDKRMAESAPPP